MSVTYICWWGFFEVDGTRRILYNMIARIVVDENDKNEHKDCYSEGIP